MNYRMTSLMLTIIFYSVFSYAGGTTDLKQIYQDIGVTIGQRATPKTACGSKYKIDGQPDHKDGRQFVSCESLKDENQTLRITIEGGKIVTINIDNKNYPLIAKSVAELDKVMTAKATDSSLDMPLKMYYGKFEGLGFMFSAAISKSNEAKFAGLMLADCKSGFVKQLVPIEKVCKK